MDCCAPAFCIRNRSSGTKPHGTDPHPQLVSARALLVCAKENRSVIQPLVHLVPHERALIHLVASGDCESLVGFTRLITAIASSVEKPFQCRECRRYWNDSARFPDARIHTSKAPKGTGGRRWERTARNDAESNLGCQPSFQTADTINSH